MVKSNRVPLVFSCWCIYVFYKQFHVAILLKPLVQRNTNVAIFIDGSCVREESEVIAYLIKVYQMY